MACLRLCGARILSGTITSPSGQRPDSIVLPTMSDPAVRPYRRHRLEVRVTPEQDALIRQAADLEDTTVTAFVLDTVTSKAKRVVKQHQDLVLSNDAFDRFIAELDKPAEPVPELVELFKKHRSFARREPLGRASP